MDVYPSLTYRDVEAALAFLTDAFGLEIDELSALAELLTRSS